MEELINELSIRPNIVEIDDRHRAVLGFGQRSAEKGYLTWRELTHLLDHMSGLPLRHWHRFDETQVREATAAAFAERDEPYKALACLERLPGVAAPAASAVMAWTDPDRFAVIGENAWRTLRRFGLVDTWPHGLEPCLQDCAVFTAICRAVGQRMDRPAHWVDRWLYTSDRLNSGTWH